LNIDASASPTSTPLAAPLTSASASSKAWADDPNNVLAHLTADDRALIKKATGFVVSPDGVVLNPKGMEAVDPFIVELAGDRMSGMLKGDVTAGYLNDMFAKYTAHPETNVHLDPNYLTRSLQYLADQNRDKRIDLSL
jgi:hypothetical protein